MEFGKQRGAVFVRHLERALARRRVFPLGDHDGRKRLLDDVRELDEHVHALFVELDAHHRGGGRVEAAASREPAPPRGVARMKSGRRRRGDRSSRGAADRAVGRELREGPRGRPRGRGERPARRESRGRAQKPPRLAAHRGVVRQLAAVLNSGVKFSFDSWAVLFRAVRWSRTSRLELCPHTTGRPRCPRSSPGRRRRRRVGTGALGTA